MVSPPPAGPSKGSIVAIGDEQLRAHVLRCAAAADIGVEQLRPGPGLRGAWHRAPVVVLDSETACSLDAAGFPRRAGVAVVCAAEPDAETWQVALALGAGLVAVLPDQQARLSAMFTDAVEQRASRRGCVLAVAGGCGGAGASTFAAVSAAAAARRGREAWLVDCVPLGGGIDTIAGLRTQPGMRWPDIRLADGRITASALRSALPGRKVKPGSVAVLSCTADGAGPGGQATAAVLDAGVRAGVVVICDVSAGAGEAATAVFERADLAVLLVRAETRAATAARAVAASVAGNGGELGVVVRGPAPGGLRPAEVAELVGAPLLEAMRSDTALPVAAEAGKLLEHKRGPTGAAASAVLDAAGERAVAG